MQRQYNFLNYFVVSKMSERPLLRKQLAAAWQATLNGDRCPYLNQLINSERGLQVHFCNALMEQFKGDDDDPNRRLFIEPTVVFGTGDKRFPDVVVCNARSIIGVIELKYRPKTILTKESYEKDIRTLELFANHSIEFANERFLGPQKKRSWPKKYPLARNAVLCWAGVYKGKPEGEAANIETENEELKRQILFLHAVTSPKLPPILDLSPK
jgi:hypothetical protein